MEQLPQTVGNDLQPRVELHMNTRDRPEYLAIALSSLLSQTYDNWDLAIADGSKQRSSEKEYVARLLHVIEQHGRKVRTITGVNGIPQTYQALLDSSKAEMILRCEDDCFWDTSALSSIVSVMQQDPLIAAVGAFTPNWNGAIDNSAKAPFQLNNGFRWIKTPTLQGRYGWVAEDGQGQIVNTDHVYDVTVIHAGSLFRTEAVRAVGGYATMISPAGHREETDLYCRLYFAGYRLVVAGAARMWHFQATSGGSRPQGFVDPDRAAMQMSDEALFQMRLSEWVEKHPDKPITILK